MENSLLQSSKKRSTKARQAGKKQTQSETPFEILCAADEQINPAIILAEELMRKNLAEVFDFAEIERAEKVLLDARAEIGRTEVHFTTLVKTHPTPANSIPLGF
jgi:hypothetical protein